MLSETLAEGIDVNLNGRPTLNEGDALKARDAIERISMV